MKNFCRAVLLTVAFFLFAGCSQKTEERIYLNSGWLYSLEKPKDTGEGKFALLDTSKISHLEKLLPEEKGYIWLKRSFGVPNELKGQDLGCFLGTVTMADITMVNGFYIGSTGYMPPNEFSAWNMVRNYTIPQKVLVNGANTLLMKVWINGEGSLGLEPFIGTVDDVKLQFEKDRLWNSRMYLMFAMIMILISAYHFVIYVRRKVDRYNLIFAAINILSAAYMLVFCIFEIPGLPQKGMNFMLFQKIFSVGTPFLLIFAITTFINEFLCRKDKFPVYVARLIVTFLPLAVEFCAPTYIMLLKLKTITSAFLIPPMFYTIFIIIRACFKKTRNSLMILLGVTPMVLCFFADIILHNLLSIGGLPYFSSIGWMFTIIAFLMLLAVRFTTALNDSEYLTHHLQDEVDNRTKELSDTNSHLQEANDELESAKLRADRDMKLAVYVQQSFYQKRLPQFDDWDIAYYFNPMTGVSGDLYDFFVEDKQLKGIGLFDVSGHGIASGLVTMLAKTIIDRKFFEGKNLPLNQVAESIDRQVVEEKGDVENYFTGVLFRLTGNKVEYVNAGHPKIFYRVAKTQRALPIEIKGKENESAGGIIGIAGLEPTFKSIGFAMNKGDSIILYTDCLSEARNIKDEEYGQERVRKSFEESGNGNAAEKLNFVLNDFNSFTNGVAMKDDLTVIVLQKK